MTFRICIFDSFSGGEFCGTFVRNTRKEAIKEAREYYAMEFDLSPKNIVVRSVKKLL